MQECVELYRVWVAFGVGLFIGGVVGITVMALLKQVEDMKCCGNCKSFLRENCPKKEQIDEFQTEFPEPNSVCDSWAFNGKKRGEK